MAQQPADRNVTTQFGHDGDRVVMIFSSKVSDIKMTVPQAESYIANLQASLERLKQHQEGRHV
jgi:hypothetical protein